MVLLQQLFGQGVVILRLHIIRLEDERVAIALQSLLQLLLCKLRIAQIVIGLGASLLTLQRVQHRTLQYLLGLLEALGAYHSVGEVIVRLKRGAVVQQGLLV